MRTIQGINFDWLFVKKTAGVSIKDHKESSMEIVNLPHTNLELPFNNFDEESFQFTSIYKKHLSIKKKQGHRYFIQFDGVAHKATIYLNDQWIGIHENGYTGFQFEVTKAILDGDNLLMVEAEASHDLNQPPFGKTIDFLTYGGIYREVFLIETPEVYIQDVTIQTKDLLTSPKVMLDVQSNGGKQLYVEAFDQGNLIYQNEFSLQDCIQIEYPFELWDLDHPKLYQLKLTLDKEDTFWIETGFREISFRKDGFYLNDKLVKIRGLNRHQIYPYVGYAMPKNVQIDDAKILKTMGNAVRTSHYPQSKHFIQACDSLGLLVFTEAPGWQHIGDEVWQTHYLRSVEEMIQQNKYHPSIVLWGVRVNESGDNTALYQKTNLLGRSLDSRPTGGVRCFSFSEELEDVYTYNDFFHNGRNHYLKDIDEVIASDIPYLITEFNGHMFPTKSFDTPERLTEHALRYAHILDEIEGNDRIAGGFGWQFIDYYTNKEFGSGDGICYHGVCDIFRFPKPAAKVYQSQLSKEPYLEVLHGNDIGDYNVGFIPAFHLASNCDYIDVYQNDRFVSREYPRRDLFPHLEHPLYVIDDVYGDVFEVEGYSKEEAKEVRLLGLEIASRGGLDKLTKADSWDRDLIKKAWDFYGKYVANWGSKSFTYRFVGSYQGTEIQKQIGPYKTYHYEMKSERTELTIDDTFDATKVTIQAIDDLGNLRKYCFDSFSVKAEGSIEIIGDQLISLIGGQRAVWVKTVKPGKGILTLENSRCKETIVFDVKIIK